MHPATSELFRKIENECGLTEVLLFAILNLKTRNELSKLDQASKRVIMMRTGSSTLNYLLGDHPSLSLGTGLGSQAITTNSSDPLRTKTVPPRITAGDQVTPPPPISEEWKLGEEKSRYYPWGTERYTSGATPTSFHFTGQRLESGIGLYFYGARWYDPVLGRFIQADSFVSGGVQGLNRYTYVGNNPINYIDPSGNAICDEEGHCSLNGQPTTSVQFGIPDSDPASASTIDTVDLTEGGAQMWQLFILYSITPGWWNDYRVGVLTFEDWFGLMMLYEIYYENDATYLYIEATARQLFMVPASGQQFHLYCPNNICVNGALNFLYAYSGTAKGQLSYLNGGIPADSFPGYYYAEGGYDTSRVMQNASLVGESILQPNSTMAFYRKSMTDRPYHFGNGSMWKQNDTLRQQFNNLPNREVLGPSGLVWYKWGYWDKYYPIKAGAILTVDQMDILQP